MNTSRRSFTIAAACIVFARTVLTARGAAQETAAATPERKSDPTGRTRDLAKAVLAASGNDARLATLNEGMAKSWLPPCKERCQTQNRNGARRWRRSSRMN